MMAHHIVIVVRRAAVKGSLSWVVFAERAMCCTAERSGTAERLGLEVHSSKGPCTHGLCSGQLGGRHTPHGNRSILNLVLSSRLRLAQRRGGVVEAHLSFQRGRRKVTHSVGDI